MDRKLNMSQGVLGSNLYSYCLNNPVNLTDDLGDKPREIFDTIDEAARDAAIYMGKMSFANNWEYCTVIHTVYQTQTIYTTTIETQSFLFWTWETKRTVTVTTITHVKYSYTIVKTDRNPRKVTAPPAPKSKKAIATVHTHPNIGNISTTTFSEQDIKTSTSTNIPAYVYGTNGHLRKFDPETQEDILVFNDLPKRLN